jgi:hypothetical protein
MFNRSVNIGSPAVAVAFDFDVAFNFQQFPCVAAVCAVQKMD